MVKAVIHAFCFLFGLVAATMLIAPVRMWVPIMLTGTATSLWVFLITAYNLKWRHER